MNLICGQSAASLTRFPSGRLCTASRLPRRAASCTKPRLRPGPSIRYVPSLAPGGTERDSPLLGARHLGLLATIRSQPRRPAEAATHAAKPAARIRQRGSV